MTTNRDGQDDQGRPNCPNCRFAWEVARSPDTTAEERAEAWRRGFECTRNGHPAN